MPDSPTRPRPIRGVHAVDPPLSWRLDAPSDAPDLPLVLGMHGWGMDEDFFALLLQRLLDRPLRLLLPRAPHPIAALADRPHAASWYDYDGDQERFRGELERTEARVVDLLGAVESEQGLAPRSRWLVGFSQGGYCGSWVALRRPDLFAGMAIVGARVKTEFLQDEMARAAGDGFRALICHGERDASVHPDAAVRSRDGLTAAGLDVDLRWFDAGHSLGRRQAAAIGEWIEAADAARTG